MADPVKQHMLDRLLRIAADRAAAPSGIRFTERQLYYELCRLLTPMHRAPRRITFTVPAPLSFATFRAALDRHEFPGLLTPTPPRTTPAGLHTPEPDLFDYGLPRLLVCESDAIAQMLRANGLPMESGCPVLSASELPLDPGIAHMLARADGTIYLLHDASPHGLTFPARLTDLTEIPENVRVVPLGLRPRQAGTLHLTHLRAQAPISAAAQDNPRQREEFHHSDSSTQTPKGLLDSESGAETAQTESSEREESHHDPASSARVTHVDPYKPEPQLISRAEAARMDSRERADVHGLEPRVRAAQVVPCEGDEPQLIPRAEAARMDSREGAGVHGLESSAWAAQVVPCEGDEPRLVPRAAAAHVDLRERAELHAPESSARAAQLDSWERAWLHHGRFVEVEAVRPASLLRTVHRLVRDVHPPRTGLPELRRARTTGFMTWPTA
ncbi:hypothetical protein [Nocardia sp. CA-135398]|uniref:hypothetical protein n=1 Tax=Nocardia sp. CA-135398 TaxID=3239977 RepID=UPI003D98B603